MSTPEDWITSNRLEAERYLIESYGTTDPTIEDVERAKAAADAVAGGAEADEVDPLSVPFNSDTTNEEIIGAVTAAYGKDVALESEDDKPVISEACECGHERALHYGYCGVNCARLDCNCGGFAPVDSPPTASIEGEREQEWFCETCGVRGAVKYRKGAGVWEVYTAIQDAHARDSEDCHMEQGTQRVRVVLGRERSVSEADASQPDPVAPVLVDSKDVIEPDKHGLEREKNAPVPDVVEGDTPSEHPAKVLFDAGMRAAKARYGVDEYGNCKGPISLIRGGSHGVAGVLNVLRDEGYEIVSRSPVPDTPSPEREGECAHCGYSLRRIPEGLVCPACAVRPVQELVELSDKQAEDQLRGVLAAQIGSAPRWTIFGLKEAGVRLCRVSTPKEGGS